MSKWCILFLSTLSIMNSVCHAESLSLKPASFQDLPGWSNANLLPSFHALQYSCADILKPDSTVPTSTPALSLTVKNWTPVCQAALSMSSPDAKSVQHFFTKWFNPFTLAHAENKGLFTGYYLPTIPASLNQTKKYSVPVYGRPYNLVTAKLDLFDPNLQGKKIAGIIKGGRLYPYTLTRRDIIHGALKNQAPVILWTKSHADNFFLQIQGSGLAQLENGQTIWLGYDGDNGQPYYPIGKWFVMNKIMKSQDVSMQKIYEWLSSHPSDADRIMNLNASYVFFKKLSAQAALGSEKVPLTPGYSLAVDNQYIPFGVPLWLNTQIPNVKNPSVKEPLQRLMIAQDTGGAIKGMIRGDIFFGAGNDAATQAGYMKNPGTYWLLLPKSFKVS